jgi:tetratricopeptide (TPR) repeat protein
MNEIKAFVGHSFSDDDRDVVGAFLKIFDQIHDLHPSFSWVHAEPAQPLEIAEKVLALIQDKNLFIGICTKKERAIPEDKLLPAIVGKFLKGRVDDFEWKTSDWIIQEIGLAMGRSMSLILLIEEGCRPPGDFQGNVERIYFDRHFPQQAFGKIVEMLTALSPPVRSAGGVASGIVDARSKEESDVTSTQQDDDISAGEPKPDWTLEDFRSAIFWRLYKKDEIGAEKLDLAFNASPFSKDKAQLAAWQAHVQMWRILCSLNGSLDRLRSIARDYPEDSGIQSDLAVGLSKYSEHIDAAKAYERAGSAASTNKDKIIKYCRQALELAKAGDVAKSFLVINEQKNTVRSDLKSEESLLDIFIEIAKIVSDDDLMIEIRERLSELRPDDFENRFSLAYKHSQMENGDLALYHYLRIPSDLRDSMAWNNLGVSFQAHGMQAKAVKAFKRAAEKGESLAMSNLAYKLMNSGFVEEAEAEFQRGLKVEGFHRNIGEGIAALKDLPETERKREEEVLGKTKPKADFYQRLGRAVGMPNMSDLADMWEAPECQLAVSIIGSSFLATGTYDRSENALSAFIPGAPTTRTAKYKIEYSGGIVGHRVDGVVKRAKAEQTSPTVLSLGIGQNEPKFCMILEDDGTTISVMENPTSTSPSFYKLSRL